MRLPDVLGATLVIVLAAFFAGRRQAARSSSQEARESDHELAGQIRDAADRALMMPALIPLAACEQLGDSATEAAICLAGRAGPRQRRWPAGRGGVSGGVRVNHEQDREAPCRTTPIDAG